MSVKFPKVHIATSVVNRILNVADGLPAHASALSVPEPEIPDTGAQSLMLNEQLATPPGELPGIDQAPDAGGTLSGRPLLDTLLTPEG